MPLSPPGRQRLQLHGLCLRPDVVRQDAHHEGARGGGGRRMLVATPPVHAPPAHPHCTAQRCWRRARRTRRASSRWRCARCSSSSATAPTASSCCACRTWRLVGWWGGESWSEAGVVKGLACPERISGAGAAGGQAGRRDEQLGRRQLAACPPACPCPQPISAPPTHPPVIPAPAAQLYNEDINDLLAPENQKLQARGWWARGRAGQGQRCRAAPCHRLRWLFRRCQRPTLAVVRRTSNPAPRLPH